MNNIITIVCASSDSYAPYCGVMLTSLFCNNLTHQIECFILSGDMGNDYRQRLSLLAEQFGQKITVLDINKELFKKLPIGERFTNISYEAYFRLLMPSLLSDRDRALYLDCDMIIKTDLAELWNTNLEGYALAAVQDTLRMRKKCISRLGFGTNDGYFNSGMGLYNLQFLRQFEFEKKVWDFVDKQYHLILYHDQDIINCVCKGLIHEVSPKWNMLESFLEKTPPIVPWQREELEEWRKKPCIIHYASLRKPWFKECLHPYKDEFWHYAAISPWNELKPVFKYHGFKRFTKYYLKRLFI